MSGVLDNIKTFFDISTLTDPSSARSLWHSVIADSFSYDAWGGRTTFKVKVLSPLLPLNPQDVAAYTGRAGRERASGLSRKSGYLFMGRIMDDPSPHWLIPDPCSAEFADGSAEAQGWMKQHTRFTMHIQANQEIPLVGDLIKCEVNQNIFSYNMQHGEALEKVDDKVDVASDIFQITAADKQGKCPFEGLANPSQNVQADGLGAGPTGGGTGFESKPEYMPATADEPLIIKSLKALGMTVYEDGRMNIVGVRATIPGHYTYNKFNDRFIFCYWWEGFWHIQQAQNTTTSGQLTSGNRANMGAPIAGGVGNGTGQWLHAYSWGTHYSYKTPGKESGGKVHVGFRRDTNKNQIANDDATQPNENRGIGLNIHASQYAVTAGTVGTDTFQIGNPQYNIKTVNGRKATKAEKKAARINRTAPQYATKDKSASSVNGWSLGCQVFKNYLDWEAYTMAANAETKYDSANKYFTYTMMDEKDLAGGVGVAGLDAEYQRFISGA